MSVCRVENESFTPPPISMRKLLALATAGLLSLGVLAATQSPAAEPALAQSAQSDYFLKIDGVDGEVAIESFSWGVTTPRDAASGQATGKRQYQPLIIRKRVDKATPLLFRVANETKQYIGTVTIVKRGEGAASSYVATFQNVQISSFLHEGSSGTPAETVHFTYQKIEMK